MPQAENAVGRDIRGLQVPLRRANYVRYYLTAGELAVIEPFGFYDESRSLQDHGIVSYNVLCWLRTMTTTRKPKICFAVKFRMGRRNTTNIF
jgi:hypothetical protein